MPTQPTRDVRVPRRALGFSLAALAAPVVAALLATEELARYSALLWLTALLPAFLLAYYRGWRGVATSLALGMATLALTQAVVVGLGRQLPDLLLPVVVVYLGISLAIGWLAEQLRQDREIATDMAFSDPLTGLPNRRHADIFLRDEVEASRRGRIAGVVLFDLDDFKRFNDTHGHAAGDAALETFADVLRKNTRRMNLAARYGGEEFIAILAGTYPRGAFIFADRVREALQEAAFGDPPLTVSGGVAVYGPGLDTPEALVEAADAALYEAKRGGRNRIEVWGGLPAEEDSPVVVPGRRAGSMPTVPSSFGRPGGAPGRARVLLVEGSPDTLEILAQALVDADLDVVAAATVPIALQHLASEFDLLVADFHVSGGAGADLIREARERWPRLQILATTAVHDARVAAATLYAGADRHQFKPVVVEAFRGAIEEMLDARTAMLAASADARPLGPEGRHRQEDVRDRVLRAARVLVEAVEVKDPFTRGRARALSELAGRLARGVLGDPAPIDLDLLSLAAEVHDVGKIAIPDQILNKPGTLTPAEFALVKEHPRRGRRLLETLLPEDVVLDTVTWHHERWDGAGYPDGLAGADIPVAARIVALVDTVEAMSRPRAFRPAVGWGGIVSHVREQRGRRFDPTMVEAFLDDLAGFEAELVGQPHRVNDSSS